jgi:hypothetical protein
METDRKVDTANLRFTFAQYFVDTAQKGNSNFNLKL